MPTYIIIEVPEQEDYEIQADYVRNVANMVDDGFIAGLDKHARFETFTPMNHATIADIKDKAREVDGPTTISEPLVMNTLHSLHGRVSNGADIDEAMVWAYEELGEE